MDISHLLAGPHAGADFSAVVCFREWTFGFVAFREKTCVLLGEEMQWISIPSWLTAVSFLLLALAEWLALRFAGRWLKKRWGTVHERHERTRKENSEAAP